MMVNDTNRLLMNAGIDQCVRIDRIKNKNITIIGCKNV